MAIGAGSGCVSLPLWDKGIAGVAGQQNAAPSWWAVSASLAALGELFYQKNVVAGIHSILLPYLESSLLEIFLEEFEVFVKLLPEGFVFDRDVGSDGILFVAIEEQEQGVIRDG